MSLRSDAQIIISRAIQAVQPVGGDDAVFGREEGVVRPDRLGVHHVQGGGPHFAAVQGVGHVLLVK